MSIDKHFERKGVVLTEDNSLPAGQRTQKNVKRVIAAVRAAEAEFNDELRESNSRCREWMERANEYIERCHQLEGEMLKYRMRERLSEPSYEKLTTEDKQRLLEASGSNSEQEAA